MSRVGRESLAQCVSAFRAVELPTLVCLEAVT